MKIALLGASFNTDNMGVGALTAGTLKAVLHEYPGAEIYLLDYGKQAITYRYVINGSQVPINLINLRFSKKIYLKNNVAAMILLAWMLKFIPFAGIREKIIGRNRWLAYIDEADLAVAISGGDSFSDIYGIERFLYVSLPQILVLLLGKDLVLLPQTLGPFRSWIARKIAKYIASKAKIVYSRDREGIAVARKMLGSAGGSEKVLFCYDVGFILDPVKPCKTDGDGWSSEMRATSILVGLNVSGLLYRGGYTGNNMFGLKMDYRALVASLVNLMIREKNAVVILVPHVFGSQRESDSIVCEELYTRLKGRHGKRLLIARAQYDQNEIKHIIGQCDFFIGSRMHACIAALSQNVPTVSIAYSRKFAGVMQSIGVGDLVADPRKLAEEEILEMADNAFEQRVSVRKHLEVTMPQVKERVLNLFSEIGSLMEGGEIVRGSGKKAGLGSRRYLRR